jgi:hypothetical protein
VLSHILDVNILHNSPKESDEFASNCDDCELRRFSGVHAVEEFEEAVLSLPSMSDDVGWLALLAFLELSRDGRPISILPSGLDEHMAAATVAGLGDGSPTNAIPGGVFGRDESEEGHELRRAIEASPVTDLGNKGHGGQRADAPETGQPLDQRFVGGRQGQGLDLFVKVIPSVGLVVEEGEVLGQDGAILEGEGTRFQETLEPFSVDLTPVTRFPKYEAPPA